MRIVWLQHVPFEGLAGIGEWAEGRGHDLTRVRVFAGEEPPDPASFDWLVVMGGPMGIHDDEVHPWLPRVRRYVRASIDADRLVVGVCLGAQFVADALGARVFPNPAGREIGWWELRKTPEAAASTLFAGVPDVFTAFHWHGDTFDVPAGAVRLAESDATAVQAFEARAGRVLALQFHLEATPAAVAGLAAGASDELGLGQRWVQTPAELEAGAHEHAAGIAALLDEVLGRMENVGPSD